jgi:hypothetical protein
MRQRSQTIIAKNANEFLEVSETIIRRRERSSTIAYTKNSKSKASFDNYEMRLDENELINEINDFNNYLHPNEEQTDPKLLCSFLTEYIKNMSDNYCPIRASLKRDAHKAMSSDCLDQIDMKHCLTNLVSSPSTVESDSGISSLLSQNAILEEEIIKVMYISLNREDRKNVLKTFIGKHIEEYL